MNFLPILASLRRSPLGPVLIALQVALTLAIMMNVAGIVQQHVERMRSVSGVDEDNVFSLLNFWVTQPNFAEASALVARDVALLRAAPGVQAAVVTNGIPPGQRGWGTTIDTRTVDPRNTGSVTRAQLYLLDDHAAAALGLHLHRVRRFTGAELSGATQRDPSRFVIVTRALAQHLFPGGDALGKTVYMQGPRPNTIVGIVEGLQTSSPGNPSIPIEASHFTVIMPAHYAQNTVNTYV